MSEENVKNPMDLNGDGKVTLDERVKYMAGKAGEKIEQAMEQIKADAKETAVGAKGFYEKAAEKAKDVYGKAADKAKDVYADAKEGAAKAAEKAKEVYADAKEGAAKAADKAKEVYEKAADKAGAFFNSDKKDA